MMRMVQAEAIVHGKELVAGCLKRWLSQIAKGSEVNVVTEQFDYSSSPVN